MSFTIKNTHSTNLVFFHGYLTLAPGQVSPPLEDALEAHTTVTWALTRGMAVKMVEAVEAPAVVEAPVEPAQVEVATPVAKKGKKAAVAPAEALPEPETVVTTPEAI